MDRSNGALALVSGLRGSRGLGRAEQRAREVSLLGRGQVAGVVSRFPQDDEIPAGRHLGPLRRSQALAPGECLRFKAIRRIAPRGVTSGERLAVLLAL